MKSMIFSIVLKRKTLQKTDMLKTFDLSTSNFSDKLDDVFRVNKWMKSNGYFFAINLNRSNDLRFWFTGANSINPRHRKFSTKKMSIARNVASYRKNTKAILWRLPEMELKFSRKCPNGTSEPNITRITRGFYTPMWLFSAIRIEKTVQTSNIFFSYLDFSFFQCFTYILKILKN